MMSLKRDFKRAFGLPIYTYHRRERMRRAREWLETSGLSVTQAVKWVMPAWAFQRSVPRGIWHLTQ